MSSSHNVELDSVSQLQRPSLLRMLSRSGRHTSASVDDKDTTCGGEEDALAADLRLRDLPTPAFIINRHAFAKNCQSVLDQANSRQFKLRPHIKTHKTLEGIHFQAKGTSGHTSPLITGFVASTIPEVKLLVNYYTRRSSTEHGSIIYGIPINETKLPPLWILQERLVQWQKVQPTLVGTTDKPLPTTKIILLMDHLEQVDMVQRFFQSQHEQSEAANTDTSIMSFQVMIKLDTGYHRAGIPSDDDTCNNIGVDLVNAIMKSPFLKFVGVYSHCGHAYDVEDQEAMQKIVQTDMDQIQSFLQRLMEQQPDNNNNNNDTDIFSNQEDHGFTISIGSTPSLFTHDNPQNLSSSSEWWKDFLEKHPHVVLEIHPGNYTLFDRQQLYTKACANVNAIAGRVLTRVIGQYNDKHRPNTILMDAGATALTKETTPQGGMAAISGILEADVYKMTQEVSMARGTSDTVLQQCPLGALLTLLPNHSCLAAACFEKYYIIDDPTCQFLPDTPIVEEWEPVKGW